MTRSGLPIGVFDSGVGGLTVARAIIDQLPNEAIRYVGDTANGPYGPLPIAEVREHALSVLDDLVAAGAKAIVIACNTASAAMLRDAMDIVIAEGAEAELSRRYGAKHYPTYAWYDRNGMVTSAGVGVAALRTELVAP